jgi:hypothetical protein
MQAMAVIRHFDVMDYIIFGIRQAVIKQPMEFRGYP